MLVLYCINPVSRKTGLRFVQHQVIYFLQLVGLLPSLQLLSKEERRFDGMIAAHCRKHDPACAAGLWRQGITGPTSGRLRLAFSRPRCQQRFNFASSATQPSLKDYKKDVADGKIAAPSGEAIRNTHQIKYCQPRIEGLCFAERVGEILCLCERRT